MMQRDLLKGGWQEEAVFDSLELCLSCKGCKGECPVRVDMATYRAEFLSHYYERKARPLAAHVFGRIDRHARLASHVPGISNFFAGTEPFAGWAKKLLGMAPQRQITPFARESFARWFAGRRRTRPGGRKVILWPDTFTNYFRPESAMAATAVLEHAGCEVHVSDKHVCCGRALYEWGLLTQAKAYLRRLMAVLKEDIAAGTPVIVLEPGCASVFRDELCNLLAGDEQATRLAAQVYLLSEYLVRDDVQWSSPRLERRAVVHAHCHHRSLLGTDAQERVLSRLGLDYRLLDSGCCGMAGSFGFQEDKYDVSIRCAERVLLPAVRAAAPQTLILADGFSCYEQIRQTTGRAPLHVSQVLDMALQPADAVARPRV
jgi:Fe-S oxidoreductase